MRDQRLGVLDRLANAEQFGLVRNDLAAGRIFLGPRREIFRRRVEQQLDEVGAFGLALDVMHTAGAAQIEVDDDSAAPARAGRRAEAERDRGRQGVGYGKVDAGRVVASGRRYPKKK